MTSSQMVCMTALLKPQIGQTSTPLINANIQRFSYLELGFRF
jgi:hypothetical protein